MRTVSVSTFLSVTRRDPLWTRDEIDVVVKDVLVAEKASRVKPRVCRGGFWKKYAVVR